jgi:hypothetical protein
MVCWSGIDVYIITAGWYTRTAFMSPRHYWIEHQCGGDDNGSTTGWNAGPTVMNNATDSSKPALITNYYHQQLSPTATKSAGEGDLEPVLMNVL